MKLPEICITFLLVICLIPGCIQLNDSEEFNKDTAKKFGLRIVKTFFTGDMDKLESYLDDEIFDLTLSIAYTKEEFLENYASTFEFFHDRMSGKHTYQDYLDVYDSLVMDREQVAKDWPELLNVINWSAWNFDEDDYYFCGLQIKEGMIEEAFIFDIDLFLFGITHEDGKWAYKAI